MKSEELVRDYYVIAELCADDDMECSKGYWLSQALEAERDEERFGVSLLHRREGKDVLAWASRLFSGKPEYYICIIVERSQRSFRVSECVHLSQNLDKRIDGPVARSVEEKIAYYRSAIARLIVFDQNEALLARRKKERESKAEDQNGEIRKDRADKC